MVSAFFSCKSNAFCLKRRRIYIIKIRNWCFRVLDPHWHAVWASYVQNSESPVGCISPPQRGQVWWSQRCMRSEPQRRQSLPTRELNWGRHLLWRRLQQGGLCCGSRGRSWLLCVGPWSHAFIYVRGITAFLAFIFVFLDIIVFFFENPPVLP